jgi:hypothetical protein
LALVDEDLNDSHVEFVNYVRLGTISDTMLQILPHLNVLSLMVVVQCLVKWLLGVHLVEYGSNIQFPVINSREMLDLLCLQRVVAIDDLAKWKMGGCNFDGLA